QFDRLLNDCFFETSARTREFSTLKGQLAASHRADGFWPVIWDRFAHARERLELIVRAYEHWDTTRWPGRSGRVTFAGVVFATFVLKQLEYLSLHVCDGAHERDA